MSATGRGGERIDGDKYYTPDAVAAACVRSVGWGMKGTFVEPSVGGGAFARALREDGYNVFGVDSDPNAAGFADCDLGHAVADFGQWVPSLRPDYVVGNPPYNQAEEHIRHGLSVARLAVGMLLRVNFLGGVKRRAFFEKHRPAQVHVLTPRPSFTGGGTDATEYAFMVWTQGSLGSTSLHWINWR